MTKAVFFTNSGELIDESQHNVMALGYVDTDPSLFSGVGVYIMNRSYEFGLAALSKLLELEEITYQTRVYCCETFKRLGTVEQLLEISNVLNNVVLNLVTTEHYRFVNESSGIKNEVVSPMAYLYDIRCVEPLLEIRDSSDEQIWSSHKGWGSKHYANIFRHHLSFIDRKLARDISDDLIEKYRLQVLDPIKAGNAVLDEYNLGYKIVTIKEDLIEVDTYDSIFPIYRASVKPTICENDKFQIYTAAAACESVSWKGDLVTSLYNRYPDS
ncbi:hypothetical protein [Vibrio harveyi]|uniref:hypothetical protein n=1 Tax=Vibrio harveyi TaxID=669 RepID=UPI0024818870|nr:hypothetical protein [Vibrio harveyi]